MILVLILLIATQCSGAEVPEDAADLAVDQVVPEEDQVEEGAASDVEVEEDGVAAVGEGDSARNRAFNGLTFVNCVHQRLAWAGSVTDFTLSGCIKTRKGMYE